MNTYLCALQQNNLVENPKGGLWYHDTYDENLNYFYGAGRYSRTNALLFSSAYNENRELALANLLCYLDIRGGKGEREVFKASFRWLCQNHKEDALFVMTQIPELGRFDYLLEGLNTLIDAEVVEYIFRQLKADLEASSPSLLAKWLPSVRTHGVNSNVAKDLAHKLGMTMKEYRQTLTLIRSKLNLVETNLSEKTYDKIDFNFVPTKAMLKYNHAFNTKMHDSFKAYLEALKAGKAKVNTKGLFCYEIIRKIMNDYNPTEEMKTLADQMWEAQKNIGCGNNTLVVADTSGSMWSYEGLPMANSYGLALYCAERATGYFKDYFITFSKTPILQKVKGNTIFEKCRNIKSINDCTDVDKVFELLLTTAKENHISQEEMPEQILIISDMQFDYGVHSKNGTNFHGWQDAFKEAGYKLPKIIFWNVSPNTLGYPASKFDQDVCMVNGFSTNVLEHIFDIENYNPCDVMVEVLKPYLELLGGKI